MGGVGLKDGRISFEIYEHIGGRSRSVHGGSKNGAAANARRDSHVSSLVKDAKDYYRDYEDGGGGGGRKSGARDSVQMLMTDDLVGECYVGFSKLMQSELRKQERRNSNIL